MTMASISLDGEPIDFIEDADDFSLLVEFPWDDEDRCELCGDYQDDHDDGDHTYQETTWFPNSMGIHKDGDEVTVTISVADPRGAYAMTIRQVEGHLIMHVPHENMGLPHTHVIRPLHEGTYALD